MGRIARRNLERSAGNWPSHSPGALNAWLLLVTTKPPTWQDPLMQWTDRPLTLGQPHEGFFYPDPLGFWAEVRRWADAIFRQIEPTWLAPESLSLSALLHVGDSPARIDRARELMRPRVIVFLDEVSWETSGMAALRQRAHHIPDPHRAGKVYEGFWGVTADGTIVGKSPQHPAAHKLYRWNDLAGFLAGADLG